MEISIRLATTADLETIIDLQTRSLSNLPAQFRKYDRHQIDSLIAGQANSRAVVFLSETTLIAEDDRRNPIGFASLLNFQPRISGLFVHPDFMNKGVGRSLLRRLELLAIEKRIGTLVVMSSMESVDFYEKNGYHCKRNTGFFSKGLVWIPCVILEKELIPSTQIKKHANQSVKIALSAVFLVIIATIAHKPVKQPSCCPIANCRVCPQTITHSQNYFY